MIPQDEQTLAEWADYEVRNRRARIEYRLRPSIVPVLIDAIDREGVGLAAQRFGIPPAALVGWFPELFNRVAAS